MRLRISKLQRAKRSDVKGIYFAISGYLPNVGLQIALEDVFDQFGKESLIVSRVETSQIDGQFGGSRVQIVQTFQILIRSGTIGQTADDVLLQFAVENVQNELAHDLLRVVKHFLDNRSVSFTQWDHVSENVAADERTLMFRNCNLS